MKLPYWDHVSEKGKMALAVIAVLQAVHFVVFVPLGIYDNIRWQSDFEEFVEQPRVTVAEHAIIWELWQNRRMYPGSHLADCLESVTGDGGLALYGLSPADCEGLPTLEDLVRENIELYAVPADQHRVLIDALEVLGGLDLDGIDLDGLTAGTG